jgi:hypothetical protein
MSNRLRRSIAERVLSPEMGKRDFALVQEPKNLVVHSPTLAVGTPVANDAQATASESKPAGDRAKGTAMWLLAGWLAVSISTITVAALVIAKYF